MVIKMKKQKRLLFAHSIFVLAITIIFSLIILKEKKNTIMIPKVEKEFQSYLQTNYKEIISTLEMNKITFQNNKFQAKITSKENKHHCFYLYYTNREVKNTYQKDYIEGNQLLKHIKKNLEKEIKEKTNDSSSVTILSPLNQYTDTVREQIISENNLLQLKFYSIEKEIDIKNWNAKEISDTISLFINNYEKNGIHPKYYEITITNQKNIIEAIKISNITEKFIKNTNKEQIIDAILKDNDNDLLKDNKITYQYLN